MLETARAEVMRELRVPVVRGRGVVTDAYGLFSSRSDSSVCLCCLRFHSGYVSPPQSTPKM